MTRSTPGPPAAGRRTRTAAPPLPLVGTSRRPGPGAGLPRHVVSHASGGRDVWSNSLPERPADPVSAARECLREVLDPELPVSVIDLGLVYGIEVEDTTARIDLTFTATACPCMEFIEEDVRDRLLRERWLDSVEIRHVWDPPWSNERITPEGRRKLRELGIGA